MIVQGFSVMIELILKSSYGLWTVDYKPPSTPPTLLLSSLRTKHLVYF